MSGEKYNHLNDVFEDLYEDGKLRPEDFDDICRIIDDANRYDKYRWHDTRENPEDLPHFNETVLITFKGYDGKYFDLAMYARSTNSWGTTLASYAKDDVIAWKRIEEFEEES